MGSVREIKPNNARIGREVKNSNIVHRGKKTSILLKVNFNKTKVRISTIISEKRIMSSISERIDKPKR
jgi:hypothetical protein